MDTKQSQSERSRQVGAHLILIDGDIVTVRLRGSLSPDQARSFIEFATSRLRDLPGFFLMIDLRGLGAPPESDSRRILVQWTKDRPPIAAAAVGGNAVVRALAMLANRATSLLAKKEQPLQFFAEESEAKAWFARQRSLAEDPQRHDP